MNWAAVSEAIIGLWSEASEIGWGASQLRFSDIYPMPGDPGFENDALFLDMPLFPLDDGTWIRVRDDVWEIPASWLPHFETRYASARQFRFNAPIRTRGRAPKQKLASHLLLDWKRATYLTLFRFGPPSALSTTIRRHRLFGIFATRAQSRGKPLTALNYADLFAVVDSLNRVDRQSIPALYEMLRWWQGQPESVRRFFEPPASVEALATFAGNTGLDTSNIRTDTSLPESNTYQPLPDIFVAALGEIALTFIEKVRPIINLCIAELDIARKKWGYAWYKRIVPSILAKYEWPIGYAPKTLRAFASLAYDCQTATHMMVSLLLGPRASELLGLTGNCPRPGAAGGEETWFLDGRTFKFSQGAQGDERDWPLHPLIGRALSAQKEYIDITEGAGFKWMWKSHAKLFMAGSPVKSVWAQLEDFAVRHDLMRLLGGTSFHQHRFRKTTARLIVIALHGGPVVLRRLLGHESLVQTMLYILSDDSIVAELKEIAEQEQRILAERFVARKDELLGEGGEKFRQAVQFSVESLKLTVPKGARDQSEITFTEMVDYLTSGPDGLVVSQIVPGLINCFKPRSEAGECCEKHELPNVARCSKGCRWNMMVPEAARLAEINIRSSLEYLRQYPSNINFRIYYGEVIRSWLKTFPKIAGIFCTDELFMEIVRG